MSNIDYYSKYKKYKAKYLLLQYGGIMSYEDAENMLYEYKNKILEIVSSKEDNLIFQNLKIKALFFEIYHSIKKTDDELKKIIKDKKDDVKEMIKELINKLPTDKKGEDIQKRTLILAIETLFFDIFNETNIKQSKVLDKNIEESIVLDKTFFTSLKEIIKKMFDKYIDHVKDPVKDAVKDIINTSKIDDDDKRMINIFIERTKINAENINIFIEGTKINMVEKRKLNLRINKLFKRNEII